MFSYLFQEMVSINVVEQEKQHVWISTCHIRTYRIVYPALSDTCQYIFYSLAREQNALIN